MIVTKGLRSVSFSLKYFRIPKRVRDDRYYMSDRIPKVNKLLKQEISNILQAEFRDLGIFSVMEAMTVADLSLSKIYIDTLKLKISDEEFCKRLNKKAPYFRQLLKKRLVSKKIPMLEFIIYPAEPENVLP